MFFLVYFLHLLSEKCLGETIKFNNILFHVRFNINWEKLPFLGWLSWSLRFFFGSFITQKKKKLYSSDFEFSSRNFHFDLNYIKFVKYLKAFMIVFMVIFHPLLKLVCIYYLVGLTLVN